MAFWKRIEQLGEENPVVQVNVLCAFFPNETREAVKDELAEAGLDEEDVRELFRKLSQALAGFGLVGRCRRM